MFNMLKFYSPATEVTAHYILSKCTQWLSSPAIQSHRIFLSIYLSIDRQTSVWITVTSVTPLCPWQVRNWPCWRIWASGWWTWGTSPSRWPRLPRASPRTCCRWSQGTGTASTSGCPCPGWCSTRCPERSRTACCCACSPSCSTWASTNSRRWLRSEWPRWEDRF